MAFRPQDCLPRGCGWGARLKRMAWRPYSRIPRYAKLCRPQETVKTGFQIGDSAPLSGEWCKRCAGLRQPRAAVR